MSVKLLDNDAFYGYRVRRTVDAELFQEYFSLKSAGKRVRGLARNEIHSLAQQRDEQLLERQIKAKKANKAARCFNTNGSVKGISYLLKTEKSGTETPIFQVGIASDVEEKIICTSYSINAHGKDLAWKKRLTHLQNIRQLVRKLNFIRSCLRRCPSESPSTHLIEQ